MKKAVFLDRDGTLNLDPGYLSSAKDLEILPSVFKGLKLLAQNDFLFIVITNQSGLGRGLVTPEALTAIHQKMDLIFKDQGVFISEYCFCPHTPADHCECRKPSPLLIQKAAQKWEIDLNKSFMVGDKKTDIQAGISAGVGGVALVRTGCGKKEESLLGDLSHKCFIGDCFLDIAQWIVRTPLK